MDRAAPDPMLRPEESQDTARRALALWAALIWLLGFELLPGVHIGMHAVLPAHVHGHADEHEHDADEHHDHDDVDHHDDDVDHHDDHGEHHEFADVDAPTTASVLDPEHGDHELLHRGIAALQPPLAMPPIHDAAFVQLERVRESRAQLGARAPTTVRARGPPAAALRRTVDRTT